MSFLCLLIMLITLPITTQALEMLARFYRKPRRIATSSVGYHGYVELPALRQIVQHLLFLFSLNKPYVQKGYSCARRLSST